MSIRHSTTIGITIIALFFFGVILIFTNQIINRSFRDMESKTILGKLSRLHETIAIIHDTQDKTTRDWAHWDDTWEFARKPNQRYLNVNFTTNTFTNYAINLIAIADTSGNLLYAGNFAASDSVVSNLPVVMQPTLSQLFAQCSKLSISDTYKGLVHTPSGTMMFVISPIIKSDGSGPINGLFMMARFIDTDFIAALPGFSNASITAIDISNKETVGHDVKILLDGLEQGDDVRFVGKTKIAAMGTIKDIHNNDLYLVEVSATMEASQIGITMRNVILLLVILVSLLQSIFLHRYLNIKVIGRVLHLQGQVKEIEQNPHKPGNVDCVGNDELTALSQSINLMLQSITKTKNELLIAKEKAEESDRLKSSFLAAMNHELRTPLNHIMGYSQLIKVAKPSQEIIKFAESIYKSGDALLRMIQDIFDMAFAEQEMLQHHPQSISSSELFQNNKQYLEDVLLSSGKQDKIQLKFHLDSALEGIHPCLDTGKVNQVLSNMFRNAIKFTNEGFVEFGMKLLPNERIQFYVRDTGIGIAPDKQQVVFDFFRQADASNTRKFSGVGIGLAISKKVTEVMNGRLLLESIEGRGSCFFLELPYICLDNIEVSKTKAVDKPATPDSVVPDFSPFTILVVEDDEISMTITRKMLETTRATILEARNGQEAVDLAINNSQINIVLMDLKMPVLDGYQASALIKQKRPHLPLIALSAQVDVENPDCEDKQCFDAYLEKPINRSFVFKQLAQYLG